jgi:hypothetical protein
MPPKKQNPFRIRDFRGINPIIIAKLASLGIKNAGQLLSAGQTPEHRVKLSIQAGISHEEILELVKLCDLARLPGVKGIRARLYYDAGVDTVEKLAAYEPAILLAKTSEFVERTGFEGTAPLPKEVSSTIANAIKLPKVVAW